MARTAVFSLGAIAAVSAIVGWRMSQSATPETLVGAPAKPPEAAPLCPWREPEADLHQFFPTATHYVVETRILSGLRLELARRLGRTPTGNENALRLNRVYHEETPLGAIMAQRVKGAYGGIELVLAVDTDRRVCGLRLQRLREPEPIARALGNGDWLHSFIGKGPDAKWRLGDDIPDVLPEARSSARALIEGARSALILLDTAAQVPPSYSG
jgi:hypothetical protein